MRPRLLCLACLLLLLAPAQACTVYEAAMDPRGLGVQVSDAEIDLAVNRAYLEDEDMKVMDIDPYVFRGHVFLVGEYDHDLQKDKAVSLAQAVPGVRSVTAHLLPDKGDDGCGLADRVAIKAKITKALVADRDIHSTNVEVKVVQCHAVLLGLVDSAVEIERAIAHARDVPGVRSVTSYLSSTLGQ